MADGVEKDIYNKVNVKVAYILFTDITRTIANEVKKDM